MVSATASSTPKQPLSYADSARKAQGARYAPTQVNQRNQPQNAPTLSSGASAAVSIRNAAPVTPASKAQATPPTHDSSSATSPPPPPAEFESLSNNAHGDSRSISNDTATSSSSSSAVKSTNPPPVNVWNVRMERMAQTQAHTQPPQSRPVAQTSHSSGDTHRASASPIRIEASDIAPASTPPQVLNGHHHDSSLVSSSALPNTAAVASSTKGGKVEEAWSSKSHSLQSTPPNVPRLDDTTAWPEVGKSIPTTPNSLKLKSGVGEELKGEGQEGETDHTTPRKSEKPKWIPIPAEELQAAVDARRNQQSRRGGHGRSRSQHRGEGRGTAVAQASTSTSASASASASASVAPSVAGGISSKAHSRAQSAVRDRTSTSGAPSMPQSQTQSRTGSVQSSPNHTSRGKRLPEDNGGVDSVISGDAHRSMRSSRAASPQSQHRPYLQLATSTNAGAPISVAPTIPITAMNPAQLRGGSPRLHYPDGRGSPYYPPPLMASYPPSHSGSSPAGTPYPIAPGFSPSPVPMPPPYAGAPPYAPYASYSYPFGGQPYPPFWAPAGTIPDPSMTYSSLPHTQPMTQLPPPAPDSKRQAAEITGSAPATASRPPSDIASQQNEDAAPSRSQPTKPTEKRRSRVMSFGSIVVDDASVPASPGSNTAALEGVTNTRPQTEAASSNTSEQGVETSVPKESGIERVFTKIAIGVDVDEGAPKVSPRPSGGIPAQADVQGGAVTEEASDRKWEFGTTQLTEDEEAKPARPSDKLPQPPAGEAVPPVLREDAVPAAAAPRSPVSPTGTVRRPVPREPTVGDPFTVKDYGYGFGRKLGPRGRPGEDPAAREALEAHSPNIALPPGGRPRRGSYSGANGFDRGYDRGYGGRGRGRGRGNRGYAGRGARGQYPVSPTIPPHRKPHMTPEFEDEAYYPAVPSPPVAYMAPGYEQYSSYSGYSPLPLPPAAYSGVPIPAPVTKVGFPLDWTRYHLLGQLEYYLGADNLAHDLFLRQKMDKRGWIPIHVLATFRRVRALTYDHQLVKDILALSSLAETRGEWIRIHRWEQYVLPDAPESTVEPIASTGIHEGAAHVQSWNPAAAGPPHNGGAYMPPAGYPEQEYAQASYGYYPPHGEYPADYAGHDSGYVPAPYSNPPEAQASGAEAGRVEGQGQESHRAAADALQEDEEDENEDSEELESDESDVEIVLGKDAGRSWTPERKQG